MSVKSEHKSDESNNNKSSVVNVEKRAYNPSKRVMVKAINNYLVEENLQGSIPEERTITSVSTEIFTDLITNNGDIFDKEGELKVEITSISEERIEQSIKRVLGDDVEIGDKNNITQDDIPDDVPIEVENDELAENIILLKKHEPEKLNHINQQYDQLPGTYKELIARHAEKCNEEYGENKSLDIPSRTQLFEITHEQDDREATRGQLMFDKAEEEDDDEEILPLSDYIDTDDDDQIRCPSCGSTSHSNYQQQTGSADEGATSFYKCEDCGKSWRGGYGA